jgi:uncharacterized protein (DUF1810 family)
LSQSNRENLDRFSDAQRDSFETALEELRSGKKRSHWMWFIFPQVAGLGHSAMAERYAIRSREEAAAYLSHPVLGPRLIDCANALLHVEGKTVEEIMGYPDYLKLKSSMTLFAAVTADSDSLFQKVLDKYFRGERDSRTIAFLAENDAM